MSFLLFAYGSLINENSRKQTLKTSTLVAEDIILSGYARKMNAPYLDGYLYLNMVPRAKHSVKGVVISVTKKDTPKLAKREEGSELVDITSELNVNFGGQVFAYMQPDKKYPEMKVLKSYINTCLSYLPKNEHNTWLKETLIENEVVDDSENPLYEFPAQD